MQNSSFFQTISGKTPTPHLKRQLQWLLFLRVVILSILLGVSLIFQSSTREVIIPPIQYISVLIAGVYLFTIISALLLNRIRYFIQFAYVQILADIILATTLIFYSGGSQSVFVSIYFFPIIAGSFILLRKGGLAMAAASTLCYGVTLIFEYLGLSSLSFTNPSYKPITNPWVAANYFSIHGITFFLVAILSFFLSERLRKTETALSQTYQDFDQLSLLYKQIFDDITTGIITIDSLGQITSFNHASEKISGYQADEIVGHSLKERLPEIELKRKGKMRPSTELTRKKGEKIPIGYSWTALHTRHGGEDCQIITLQDLSEIKKMEDQVRQAEKMAALGEMAAGIAHEFRNPLAAISGSAQMLNREFEDNSFHHNLMKIIVRECSRLDTIISDFLQFSKPAVPEKEWLSLNNLMEECIQLIKQTPVWRESHHISLRIPEKIGCWGDSQQLKRVLINLIHNACASFDDNQEGKIQITALESAERDTDEKTIIKITDNGPGIPEKIIDKIFNPFFTTRKSGTGLGLAIVHQIIDSHRGDVRVVSRKNEGTTFEISLPLP